MPDLQPMTVDRLSARLAREQSERRLPSLVAGLVRDGSIVWSGARGSVGDVAPTEDTQYRMGSITKTFVAVCVMRLRDEGRLDLADPLERHLPGTALGDVTVAQLLSHASGLQAETDGPWWERTPGGDWPALAASLAPAWMRHRAGRRFHYSNVGFGVLGELVARLRDASWIDVVRAELLAPLGMSRTTTRPTAPYAPGIAVHPWADVLLPEPEHDAGAMAPAGQLWTTVSDLSRWAAFLGGDTAGALNADTLAEMREPLIIDDQPGAPWTGAYGLGLQLINVGGRRFAGHGGSMPGFLASLRVDVETRDAVVVLTNTTAGLSAELPGDLLGVLREQEPPAVAPWVPSPVAAEILELAGPWYWGPSPLALRIQADGWLSLDALGTSGRARASRFRPSGDSTWTGLDGYYAGETLRVVRRPDRSISHLDLASFVLTRTPYDPEADIPGGVAPAGWR
ncbi:MAG: serine hydrolase domain-containing protein [Egibacteraceae bacterium]